MPAPMRVLIHAERPEGVAAAVAERHPDAEVAVCDSFDALPDAAAGIDPHAAYTERFERRPYPREALLSQPSLAFVHVSGAGVNHLAPWDPRKVQVCNAAGVQDEGMALFAIGRLIAVACNFFLYHDQQKRRVWRVHDAARSPGGVLTVVGLGRIGRACARAAGALGMTVHGVRARPRPCEGVERVVGPDGLREVLGKADYVIVSTPLTERTRGMIDAAAIAAMKPGAILHDMSRGGVVDGEALVAALRSGRVRAASLDVFAEEPLPPDSPFWDMDNVHVTPHVGGMMTWDDYDRLSSRVFLDNLDRFARGEPLVNATDPDRGY